MLNEEQFIQHLAFNIQHKNMNQLKRFAGIIWLLLGPAAVFYLDQNSRL
jgi:hypothetical protein